MLSVAIHKDIAEYQPKVIGKLTGRYGCVLTASVCATWIRRNKKLWSIFLQELLSDMSCRRNYSFCNGTFPKPAFRL